jgi:hypothetical protein
VSILAGYADRMARTADDGTLTALALNCTLTAGPAESSTDKMAGQVLDALAAHDVSGEVVRVVDHDVPPGVEADMGDGDGWPAIREKRWPRWSGTRTARTRSPRACSRA